MCKKSSHLIEELEQVLCVLRERYKGKVIEARPVMYVGPEFNFCNDENFTGDAEYKPDVFYYGIFTTGVEACNLYIGNKDGYLSRIKVASDSQIIELFNYYSQSLVNFVDFGGLFRGWQIVVQNG